MSPISSKDRPVLLRLCPASSSAMGKKPLSWLKSRKIKPEWTDGWNLRPGQTRQLNETLSSTVNLQSSATSRKIPWKGRRLVRFNPDLPSFAYEVVRSDAAIPTPANPSTTSYVCNSSDCNRGIDYGSNYWGLATIEAVGVDISCAPSNKEGNGWWPQLDLVFNQKCKNRTRAEPLNIDPNRNGCFECGAKCRDRHVEWHSPSILDWDNERHITWNGWIWINCVFHSSDCGNTGMSVRANTMQCSIERSWLTSEHTLSNNTQTVRLQHLPWHRRLDGSLSDISEERRRLSRIHPSASSERKWSWLFLSW